MTDSSDNSTNETGGRFIRLLAPLVILCIGGYVYHTLSAQSEEEKKKDAAERTILTRVMELSVQDYPIEIITQGIVQSHNEITMIAQVSGEIKKLSPQFEVGAYFEKGEVLFEMDDRDYIVELKKAEASHLSAQSALQLAKLNHKRMLDGFDKRSLSIVTKAEVDQALASLTGAEADLVVAEASLEQAKLDLSRTKIHAPFDGRVRDRMVGLGQMVNSGTVSATIYAVDYAEIRLPISARDREFLSLPELEGASAIPVNFSDAIDTDSQVVWEGQIIRTEGSLDEGTLELMAVARVNDPFGLKSGKAPLHIGQPVTGKIIGKTLKNIVPIPRKAVRELDQIILINKSDLTLTRSKIEAVWTTADYLYVPYTPLYENMWIATSHIVYAPEGAIVEIIPEVKDLTDQSDETLPDPQS